MSDIINQNTEPLFIFDMPDDETLSETISVKGEKGERGDPTKLSQLDNDTGFITKNVTNLTNYYDKTTTDDKLNQKLDEATFDEYEIPTDFFTGAETLSGTGSSIALNGTAEAIFKGIIIYGNTTQSGTPSPQNPMSVQIATGLQTITINGKEYLVNLGDIELCRIAEYRDRIYNAADGKWYKHKEVEKVVLDGSVDEGWITSGVTYRPNTVNFSNLADATSTQALSNLFTVWPNAGGGISTRLPNLSFGWAASGNKLMAVRYDASESLEDFKTLLGTTPMVIYYELAQAVEEELTDAALIAQLEAIKSAKTGAGTTNIVVSGTLPVALAVEAFKDDWSGAIAGLNAGIDERYNKSETDILMQKTVEPYKYPYPKLSMSRIYRELNAKNYDGLSTYDNTASGASCIQGGVSTGDNKMLFTYWNGDNININENKIVEKNILTGAVLKEVDANYGWCNGLAYNPDKGLVYVVPRGRSGTGGSNLKEIVILNYDDLSYIETITLNTDKTIQSAYYANGELWVMAEGAKKFYKIDTSDYSILETVTPQIPSPNSDFYYQNFAIANNKFYIIGSLPHALYIYNLDGSFFRQYDMPKNMNGVHAVGELQFIDHISDNKFYIGSTIYLGVMDMAQVAILDLDGGYINSTRNSSTNTLNGLVDLYVDQSSASVNPDGSSTNPFKEISEACLMENKNVPARVYIADGEYELAYVYGCNNYRFYSASQDATDVVVKGFSMRYCDKAEIYALTVNDSDIIEQNASVFAHCSTLTITESVINSTAKYGVLAQELTVLNIARSNTITSGLSNVYVSNNSTLKANSSSALSLRKTAGAIVDVDMPLFASDQALYLGDATLNATLAAWFNKALFKFVNIEYTFGHDQQRKVVKYPASLGQFCITDEYVLANGDFYIARAFIQITSSYVRVGDNINIIVTNNNGSASIATHSLDDNADGTTQFIKIVNVYMSDN